MPDRAQAKAYDAGLDVVRMIAITMVIFIHVSGKGFHGMGEHWWAINAYESASRVSVPLFFMVTGALLLPRDSTVSSIIKRIWRVVVPLAVWSVAYLAWFKYVPEYNVYYNILGASSSTWLEVVLRGPTAGHLWYLYTLIAAYLFLPVMSSFYRASSSSILWFVLAIWFVASSVMPFIHGIAGKGFIGINWSFFYIYPAYFILGAVIWHKSDINRNRALVFLLLSVACACGTAFGTWAASDGPGKTNELYYEYYAPCVFLGAASLFAFVKWLSGMVVIPRVEMLKGAAGLSFGVYLVHPFFIWFFDLAGFDYSFINPWISVPVISLAVLLSSCVFVAALQRIPLLRSVVPN